MKTAVAVTLILCGTFIAALPVIAIHFGTQIADFGAMCYIALGATMIISAIVGSMARGGARQARGFELLPLAASQPKDD